MKEYTLTRTGDRPLSFTGELLAVADGRIHSGQEQNRWHEIRVYKTAGGKYVLEIEYCTCWQGENSHHRGSVHSNTDALLANLRDYNPIGRLIGFPPHPTYAEKQARLEESLRQRWETLVTEIFDEIPDAAERIE